MTAWVVVIEETRSVPFEVVPIGTSPLGSGGTEYPDGRETVADPAESAPEIVIYCAVALSDRTFRVIESLELSTRAAFTAIKSSRFDPPGV